MDQASIDGEGEMSRWWGMRLIWLGLGLLTGVIGFMPESASIIIGILALIYVVAWGVLLTRIGIAVVRTEIKTALENQKPDNAARTEVMPSTALFWDSLLFLGAVAGCAGLFALMNWLGL